ncbi:hypothetical protein MMC16_001539 [Acarospora aff. strigata]|nr:hypothetical protein [Acarospora aff. strigata]
MTHHALLAERVTVVVRIGTVSQVACVAFSKGTDSQFIEPLIRCSNENTGNVQYCCAGDDTCNCDTGRNTVKLGGLENTVTKIGATSWSFASSSRSSTSSSSRTSTETPSNITISLYITTSSYIATSSYTTTSSTPTASTVAASATDSPALAPGAIAGIAVGAACALALSGSIIYYLRRRRSEQPLPPGDQRGWMSNHHEIAHSKKQQMSFVEVPAESRPAELG